MPVVNFNVFGNKDGNVGISNNAPTNKLHVTGTSFFGGATSFLTNTWHLSSDGKNRFHFGTNNRTYYGSGDGTYEYRSSTDSSTVFIANSGNIGINLFPTNALTIAKGAGFPADISLRANNNTAGAELLIAQDVNGLDSYVYNRANGPLFFGTNNVERMRITAAGNVGIGTTTPSGLLHLGGSSNKSIFVETALNRAYFGGWQDFTTIGVNRDPSTGNFYDANKAAASIGLYSASANSYVAFSTTPTNNSNPIERMRIASDGNVGIGTTSPSYKLDIAGASYARLTTTTYVDGGFINARTALSGGTFNTYDFVEGSTTTAYLRNYGSVFGSSRDNQLHLWNTQNSDILFGTSNAERIRITSAGNVGIGTASPSEKLEAFGTDASIIVHNTGNSRGGISALNTQRLGFLTTASSDDLVFGYSGSSITTAGFVERMRIDNGTGNVGIGITSPVAKLSVVGETSLGQGRKLTFIGLDINSVGTPNFIKIKTNIPTASASADFTVNIKGFRYSDGSMCDLSIGWHYYLDTFYNAAVKSSGSFAPTVRLSSENNLVCIVLTAPGYWPKLYVESMYSSGYSDTYATGWTWVDEDATGNPLVTVSYKSNFGNQFVMTAAGNVGIGTTVPAYPLSVGGAVEIRSAAALHLRNSLNTNFTSIFNNSGSMVFETNYLERMRITSDGRIGIGSSTVDTGQNVTLTGSNTALATAPYFTINNRGIPGTTGTVYPIGGMLFASYRDVRNPSYIGGITMEAVNNFAGVTSYAKGMIFRVGGASGSTGGLNFSADGDAAIPTERMRIDGDGNVGIGVIAPYAKLNILKASTYGNEDAAAIAISSSTSSGTASMLLGSDNTNTISYIQGVTRGTNWNHNVAINPNGGNVGIGTIAPGSKLQVTADGSSPVNTSGTGAFRLRSSTTAAVGVGPSIIFEGQTNNTTTNYGFAAIQGFKSSSTADDYSGSLAFYTQNSGGSTAFNERMRITNAGVIIGNGETSATPVNALIEATDGSGTNIAGASFTVQGGRSTGTAAGGAIIFSTAAASGTSGTALNAATERMRINSAGNVGIGVDPSHRLHVSGNALVSGVFYNNSIADLGGNSKLSWTGGAGQAIIYHGPLYGTGTETFLASPDSSVGRGSLILGDGFNIDALAFISPSSVEYSDGTTWTAGTVNSTVQNLFMGKHVTNFNTLSLPTNQAGVRFTWTSSQISMYQFINSLMITHSTQGNNVYALLEYSIDAGVTWTTQIQSATFSSWPGYSTVHAIGNTPSNSNRIRLSIIRSGASNGNAILVGQISMLGSYGTNSTNKLFDWDFSRNISLPNGLSTVGSLSVGTTTATKSLTVKGTGLAVVGGGTQNIGNEIFFYRSDVQPMAYIGWQTPGDANSPWWFNNVNGNPTAWASNGSELMRLTAAGNLGIGTTNPLAKVQVALTGASTASITTVSSFGTNGIFSLGSISNNSEGVYLGTGYNNTGINGGIASGLGFFREASGWNTALAFYTNGTTDSVTTNRISERMRITSGGLVGIGTVAPSARLQVSGATPIYSPAAGSGSGGALLLTNTDVNYGWLFGVASNGNVWAQAQRVDGGTSVYNMTLQPSGGNVGIGNTAPTHLLSVNGTSFFAGNASFRGNQTLSANFTRRVVTAGSIAANNTTYELCRISRDSANWSTQFLTLTVYNRYYRGGKTVWNITFNQANNGTVVCAESAGTSMHKVYLGAEVIVSGTIGYRPVLIDIPAYEFIEVEIVHGYTEVTSTPSGASSIQFTGTSTANASAVSYSGDIHLVPSGGNIGVGTITPVAKLDVWGPQRSSSVLSTATNALRLAFDGGAIAGDFGSSINFSQRFFSTDATQVNVGQIAGVKIAVNGNFGGGLAFSTSNGTTNSLAERMRITDNGNVGIGTTSPSFALTVAGQPSFNGVPLSSAVNYDELTYFSLQRHLENNNINCLSGGGTAPTYANNNNTTAPFSRIAVFSAYFEAIGSEFIPVQPGERLYGEIYAQRITGAAGTDGTLYVGIARYDKDKNPIATNIGLDYFITTNSGVIVPKDSNWTKYSGHITLPTSHTPFNGSDGGPVRYIRPYIIVNTPSGTITTFIGGFTIRKVAAVKDVGDISVNGNLGVGTTSPAAKLDAYSASGWSGVFSGSGSRYIGITADSAAVATDIHWDNGSPLRFSVGTSRAAAGYTELMRISPSGNVAIGSTTVTQKFQVSPNDGGDTRNVTTFFNTPATYNAAAVNTPEKVASGLRLGWYSNYWQIGAARAGGAGVDGMVISVTNSSVNTNVMVLGADGKVGIGNTSPLHTLVVQKAAGLSTQGELQLTDGTYLTMLNSRQNPGTYNPLVQSGDHTLIFSDGSIDTGSFVIAQHSASTKGMRIAANGNIGIATASPGYTLQVNGSFAATTKSFVIDHPTKPNHKLRYGSLESPYHGVRLTGEAEVVDGICTVKLPDYIHALCKSEGVNIQLTNIKHGKVLWVDEIDIDSNEFTVATETNGNYKFYWSFTAIRKDIEDMIVEFESE